jgi:RNA polymerase sigma-70 factor (ECF subfamily)
VYVKLWGMRSELSKYNSIEALCVRITRNLCLDQLRRRKVNHDAMKAEKLKVESYPETPSENLEKKENAELLHTLISALPEPQRSLVHLRHLEGKEYEEIAEMVNMNVNAIRVSISRARKQMRALVEKQYSSWRV